MIFSSCLGISRSFSVPRSIHNKFNLTSSIFQRKVRAMSSHTAEIIMNDKYAIVPASELVQALNSGSYRSVLYTLQEGNTFE